MVMKKALMAYLLCAGGIGEVCADAPQAPKSGYGPEFRVRMHIAETGCGDSCVATIMRGKAPNQYYVCYPADMVGPKSIKLCRDMFVGAGGKEPDMRGREIDVALKKIGGMEEHYRIVGGSIVGKRSEASKPRGSGNSGEFSWDKWLEATGNKTKVGKQTADAEVSVVGVAPASIGAVRKACQGLLNRSGPGGAGVGSIYAVKYFPPVDGSSVYGSNGPQVKLTPAMIHAKYRDGEEIKHNVYLHKDAFGEMKCMAGR